MNEQIGLVIGGGGSVGIAWEVSVLKALETFGVDLKSIPIVIGTSAGSLVGAQYFGGRNIDDIVNEQRNPGWMVKATKLLPTNKSITFTGKNAETETQYERSKRLSRASIESRPFIL